MDKELTRRKETCLRYSLTEQPLPVIVGPSICNIVASYVIVNDIRYTAETPLKAIDTCFKIYHTLNAKYPLEAEVPWTFIQTYVYEIHSQYDKKYVSVNTLIADIERHDNS